MKGLILLFLAIVFSSISWSYLEVETKQGIKRTVRRHLWAFVIATMAVAIATFVSTNTTLRLV